MGTNIHCCIGWDVGGWNCDKNRVSRDAIVILDDDLQLIGVPWRGNLRTTINECITTESWLKALFRLCQAPFPESSFGAIMAIDTPLGFSQEFTQLVTELKPVDKIDRSGENPYLFRQTERNLFAHGLRPLSPIKDMIGSQATKGIHVLGKYTPHLVDCGIWTDGSLLTCIEAYPSGCKQSNLIQTYLRKIGRTGTELKLHQDEQDALICALIAYLFSFHREMLNHPPEDLPNQEGWIWIPKDALSSI